MTPHQWSDIAGRVEAMWGRSTKWAHASGLAHQVQAVSHDLAVRAIDHLVGQAEKYAPSPAQIIGLASQHSSDPATVQRLAEGTCERDGHLLGAPSPEVVKVLDRADMICTRCGTVQSWTIEEYQEAYELA